MPTSTRNRKPRHAHDFYKTPYELALAAMNLSVIQWPRRILDAGAGDGVWGRAALSVYPSGRIDGIDIRDIPKPEGYSRWTVGNFLEQDPTRYYNAIIGNPPYDVAEDFVRHSLAFLANMGVACLLLPLAFQGSQGRGRGLWQEFRPTYIYNCVTRPSFTDGGTDMAEYSIYIWNYYDTIPMNKHDTIVRWLDWQPN